MDGCVENNVVKEIEMIQIQLGYRRTGPAGIRTCVTEPALLRLWELTRYYLTIGDSKRLQTQGLLN